MSKILGVTPRLAVVCLGVAELPGANTLMVKAKDTAPQGNLTTITSSFSN